MFKNSLSKLVTLSLVTAPMLLSSTASSFASNTTTPENTAYFLTGIGQGTTLSDLGTLIDQIKTNKANFNKLVLSFAKPELNQYQSGSLNNTGLFGYFTTWSGHDAKADFQTLKNDIQQLQQLGVAVYLSVGGWNYSCSPKYYTESLGKDPQTQNACGPQDENYDTFPNPIANNPAQVDNSSTQAVAAASYKNLVQFAKDLGVTGIDVDYEEFWHADLNSYSWQLNPDNSGYPSPGPGQAPKPGLLGQYVGQTISYDQLINIGKGNRTYQLSGGVYKKVDSTHPQIMPDTVDKLDAILKTIFMDIQAIDPDLKVSMALPVNGAIPNMASQWGTVNGNVQNYGGAWWGGNLVGLTYNLAWKDPETINKLSSLGIMSYDLGSEGTDCGGSSKIPCDLPGQVDFYMGLYSDWLKAKQAAAATVIDDQPISYWPNKIYGIQPAKLAIKPQIQVGFEVGQPAYGNLALTKDDLNSILSSQARLQDGMIMWDINKDISQNWQADWATPKDVLQQSCVAFGLNQQGQYNCNANVPAAKTLTQKVAASTPLLKGQSTYQGTAKEQFAEIY